MRMVNAAALALDAGFKILLNVGESGEQVANVDHDFSQYQFVAAVKRYGVNFGFDAFDLFVVIKTSFKRSVALNGHAYGVYFRHNFFQALVNNVQCAGQVFRPARMALDLTAGGFGQGRGLDEDYGVHLQLVP